MTVIAALADGKQVVMAADTCTGYCGTQFTGARKIVRIKVGDDDEALLACSGQSALLAVAERHWSVDAPDPDDVRDVERWANACASALTEIAAEQEPPLLADSEGGTRGIDGAFLLGWRGRLIYLFTHAALVVPDGVAALGIGVDLALGALQVHRALGTPPVDAGCDAVRMACDRFEGCAVGAAGPLVETLGTG